MQQGTRQEIKLAGKGDADDNEALLENEHSEQMGSNEKSANGVRNLKKPNYVKDEKKACTDESVWGNDSFLEVDKGQIGIEATLSVTQTLYFNHWVARNHGETLYEVLLAQSVPLVLSARRRDFHLTLYICKWNNGRILDAPVLQMMFKHHSLTRKIVETGKKLRRQRRYGKKNNDNRNNRPFQLVHFASHFRPRDTTRGNSFFQMSSYARANLRITNEKTKGKFPWGHHVVWNGKKNVQAEKVY